MTKRIVDANGEEIKPGISPEGMKTAEQLITANVLEKVAERLERFERKLEHPAPKPTWRRILSSAIKIYVFVFSAVGFTMFIGEESVQTTGFSCFGYSEAKDFTGMDMVCRAEYATVLDWYCTLVNNPVVLIANPLLTPAYQMYCTAGHAYLQSIITRIQFQR